MAIELERLRELLVLLREFRVTKFGGEWMIELAPEAQTWPAQTSTANVEPPCKCGHSIAVEHNEQGLCLQGCEVETCHPE